MRSSSTRYERDPARRYAPLGRFAAIALAVALLAACQSIAPSGGDRFDRTASADSAKRAVYGDLGNQR